MENTVLMVVDVQTDLVEGNPYNMENVLTNIKNLISTCKSKNIEVIYIRHDGGLGDELEYGSKGWQIHESIAPKKTDKIFDKRYNSAFKETGLKEYLDKNKINNIILVGMQTEYCIDSTCKIAFEYGYNVIIPEDTVTTYDNACLTGKELCDFYTYNIWNNRFAKVVKKIDFI